MTLALGGHDRVVHLFSALADLVLPRICGGCGEPGPPWCPRCAAWLRAATGGRAQRVVLTGGRVAYAAGRYEGPLRAALLSYKERHRHDLTVPLARLLVTPLAAAVSDGMPWLIPVPSQRSAIRARGGDHVLRLCRALARVDRRCRVVAALRLRGRGRDSVGLDARQRAANLAGRLTVRRSLPPLRGPVLLVDDVVTTGATLRACQTALAARGVTVDGAIVLCAASRG